jgi:hypothetical protein
MKFLNWLFAFLVLLSAQAFGAYSKGTMAQAGQAALGTAITCTPTYSAHDEAWVVGTYGTGVAISETVTDGTNTYVKLGSTVCDAPNGQCMAQFYSKDVRRELQRCLSTLQSDRPCSVYSSFLSMAWIIPPIRLVAGSFRAGLVRLRTLLPAEISPLLPSQHSLVGSFLIPAISQLPGLKELALQTMAVSQTGQGRLVSLLSCTKTCESFLPVLWRRHSRPAMDRGRISLWRSQSRKREPARAARCPPESCCGALENNGYPAA